MADEASEFGAFLARRGLRRTRQRRAIAESAFATHRHFTAEELYSAARRRDPSVGRVTVYRTLEHLVGSGMVEELGTGRGVAVYEHVAGHSHHDHLVCRACGAEASLRSAALEKALAKAAREAGWSAEAHSLRLRGLCPACRRGLPGA